MTPRRRELMFKCMDGDMDLARLMHMFHQFYQCDRMLAWLVQNRLTGKNLRAWLKAEFEGSTFQCGKYVLNMGKREDAAPVIGGVDFITAGRPT